MSTWDELTMHPLVRRLSPMSDEAVDVLKQILNDIDSQSESSSSTPGDASEPTAAVGEYSFRAPRSDWRVWCASIEQCNQGRTAKVVFHRGPVGDTETLEIHKTLGRGDFQGCLDLLAECFKAAR